MVRLSDKPSDVVRICTEQLGVAKSFVERLGVKFLDIVRLLDKPNINSSEVMHGINGFSLVMHQVAWCSTLCMNLCVMELLDDVTFFMDMLENKS